MSKISPDKYYQKIKERVQKKVVGLSKKGYNVFLKKKTKKEAI